MTVEDLNTALEPVIEVLEHQAQVQYGIIVGLGVIAGLLVIYLLLHKF